MNTEEEKIKARRNIYHALSAGFYVPEADNLTSSYSKEFSENFKILEAWTEAKEYVQGLENASESYSSLEELLIEHSKLFLGPDKLLAPPYGSYYIDDKVTMGESTRAVMDIYEKLELELSDSFKDLPDHIALELNFLAYLTEQQLVLSEEHKSEDSGENVLKWQKYFLENCLAPWYEPFVDRIKNNFDSEYYDSLADILAYFLAQEREYLARIA
ncbi:TorD/DmsD family molecular chaperone [Halarsenatibacter silvermanii]|uniref:Chaperone TorD involved in molybdoenzyme TorA maturation n=1 Tax=Halarsenatibacter silvermanii TaxID=321763 RepID=B4YYQ8_9FIRM|nr:molecular chaperone TorD family protein [Halarsenatibacter silvermanii]ACF74514.1 TorD-like molybdenum cofator chaperone [Halarsenatibacter silvermanii]SDM39245.1 chaperone TorD involved in molybdoenzyme TorA maturation [Halarsenatibacter silvermanii]